MIIYSLFAKDRSDWRVTQVAIRGSPAKGVDGLNRARVRIPHSPPLYEGGVAQLARAYGSYP